MADPWIAQAQIDEARLLSGQPLQFSKGMNAARAQSSYQSYMNNSAALQRYNANIEYSKLPSTIAQNEQMVQSQKGGGVLSSLLPIVAIVASVVAPGLGSIIGAEILGTSGAIAAGTAVAGTAEAIVGSAVLGGGMTAVQGGSPEDILKSAITYGAVAGLGSGISSQLTAGPTSGLQVTGMLPEVASTVDAGLATAETAAAAGDAYLPGALSNPFLQAMPTLSSMAQAAATNAGMQLVTTGTIDPEKVLESVVTGAAGSTLGNLAGIAAGNALDSNLVRSVVSGAVSGATQAAINGTDPVTAALASGAASGLGYEARENNINVPQQSINAVVNSIATGAPLEKTLLNAAISIGVGAAKDAVSGISSADTQAPAPVETRTPISPLPADSGNVTTAELSDTSPSGYVIAGTEIPANADGSIYSGLSVTGGGTNVAAVDTGTTTDVTAGLISTDNFLDPSLPGFRYPVTQAEIDAYISYGSQNNPSFISITGGEAQSGDVLLENDNEVLEGTGNNNTSIVADTTEENIANTGALSSIDVANINNNTLTAADTKTAVGFNDYSDIVYQTADGIFVDSSNNPVAAPSTKLDGTPFNDALTGSATGTANTVVGGLSSVAGVDGAGSILDGSSTVDGTITGGQGRTGADATFIDGDGNVVDGSGNLVTGGHNDTLVGGVTTDPVSTVDGTPSSSVQTLPEVVVTPDDEEPTPPPEVDWEPYVNSPDTNAPPTTTLVTPAVTTTVGGGGLPTTTTTTPAAAAGVAGTLPDVNRLLADDSTKYPSPIKPYLQPNWITTGSPSQSSLWTGLDPKLVNILSRSMANGGQVHPQLQRILADRGYEMNPVEMVAGPEDRYYARHAKRGFAVNGPGTGQSDDIPTMLADSEYVIDADTVAALGDGSSKAGAEVLDKMRMAIRKHKRSAPINKIPPKAKSPLDYITEGMKMNAKKK